MRVLQHAVPYDMMNNTVEHLVGHLVQGCDEFYLFFIERGGGSVERISTK
jgi:hypothetical protein